MKGYEEKILQPKSFKSLPTIKNKLILGISKIWTPSLTSSNSPDGFIGNDNILPGILRQLALDSIELAGDDIQGLSSFSLFETFTNAEDDAQVILNSVFGLIGNNLIFSKKWRGEHRAKK